MCPFAVAGRLRPGRRSPRRVTLSAPPPVLSPTQVPRDPAHDARARARPGAVRGAAAAVRAPAGGARLPAALRLLRAQRGPLHVSLPGFRARWHFQARGEDQPGVRTAFFSGAPDPSPALAPSCLHRLPVSVRACVAWSSSASFLAGRIAPSGDHLITPTRCNRLIKFDDQES